MIMMKWFKRKKKVIKDDQLIDIYLTTFKRPTLLQLTLSSLFDAIRASPFNHRVIILADALDPETNGIIEQYRSQVFILSTPTPMGLPFMFNMIHDFHKNLIHRSERAPKLICYLQDDCIITYPQEFFKILSEVADHALPSKKLAFISGFYTPLHPGFSKRIFNNFTLVESDSIDGKNLVCTPELLESIGPISWYNKKGNRRGNPGPIGSGFDLWQWRDAPNSTLAQKRINLIIPGLIDTIGAKKSTWGNESDDLEVINQRLLSGKIYNTRGTDINISPSEFFNFHKASPDD
jgi:hypothetical protein